MKTDVSSELKTAGIIRAGINLSNFLLVSGRNEDGKPFGVAPDMARAVAQGLDCDIELICFPGPGVLADAASKAGWDIGLIAAEPARAELISFSPAYVEIEATYMVRDPLKAYSVDEIDKSGIRIGVAERSAYDLFLTRTLKSAELVRAKGLDASYELFVNEKLDALAGLRPKLMEENEKMAGSTILPGQFTAVQQSIGCGKNREEGLAFLVTFVEETKTSGFVADLIEKHGVVGRLSVAPPN